MKEICIKSGSFDTDSAYSRPFFILYLYICAYAANDITFRIIKIKN